MISTLFHKLVFVETLSFGSLRMAHTGFSHSWEFGFCSWEPLYQLEARAWFLELLGPLGRAIQADTGLRRRINLKKETIEDWSFFSSDCSGCRIPSQFKLHFLTLSYLTKSLHTKPFHYLIIFMCDVRRPLFVKAPPLVV